MGTLFLVATPIGNRGDISPRAVETLRSVDLIAAEDTRHTGRLLDYLNVKRPLLSYHQLNERSRREQLLAALAKGDVAIVSDAGTPGISDPGFDIVTSAIGAGHRVSPLPGPSAVMAAVSASGLVENSFCFQGFLPRKGGERRRAITQAGLSGVPVVIFEAANRLVRTLGDLRETMGERQVAVARELTKLHEEIVRGSFDEVAARFEHVPPRGEIVIVVGPRVIEPGAGEEDDIESLMRSLLRDGLSPTAAAREASAIVGIPRREAYRQIQRLTERASDSQPPANTKG